MISPEVKGCIDQALSQREHDNQFQVSKVPLHTHNGIDAPKVSFSDLKSSSQYLALATVTIPTAKILTLHTAAFSLVTVGYNVAAIVDGIQVQYVYNGTAYTGTNNVQFLYGNISGGKVAADFPYSNLNDTVGSYVYCPPVTAAFEPVFNAPVVAAVQTANPGAGSGTLVITVRYHTIQG
jgi:hypothetical protein